MAKGNEIIVTAEALGVFTEGTVKTGQTFYPGMIVQRQASAGEQDDGRHIYEYYAPGTDGEQPKGAFWVVLNDTLGMKTTLEAIAAGERCFLYSPRAGEDINLLVANIAGTADDHAAGEMLIVDTGTGKLIATTGSPETEVAQLLEAITDPTADTLAWCQWTGH